MRRLSAKTAAVVPAAGLGSRFGKQGKKIFAGMASRPLLIHALRVLQASPWISCIQVVARPQEHARIRSLTRRFQISKSLPPCEGGQSRSASVASGIRQLPADIRWVVVHDGARPCVTQAVIERVLKAAQKSGAATCGMPASVTVKQADKNGTVKKTLDRRSLWFIQTPQAFRRDIIEAALAKAKGRLAAFPDDAAVVEAAGFRVKVVAGDACNIKITTKQDLIFAEAVLKHRR